MSLVHNSSMPPGWKSRLTRSARVGGGRVGAGRDLEHPGLMPAMPRPAMRAATVLWLTCSPASCRSVVIRGRRRCPRALVEAEDLGVQVRPAFLARQRRAVLGRPPAVVAGRETSSSRAMRVISKFAHSAAINANLSALVDSKRSTRQLFPRRPGLCPARRPGGAAATARPVRPDSAARPCSLRASPSAGARHAPTVSEFSTPRARRRPRTVLPVSMTR